MKKYMTTAIIIGLVAVVAAGIMIVQQTETSAAFATAKESEAEKAAHEMEKHKEDILARADQLLSGYFYDEAIDLLKSEPAVITTATDDAIQLKIAEVLKAKNSLVRYEGPVQHIFFHSLIIYPELAFDRKGHPANGYNMWMATVSEFEKMLPELEKKGYVLYPLTEYIEPDSQNPNKVKLKD
ncbi:MAG TPA: hypothetical protein VEA58_13450, partial [Anaerovoracaceae bacterium]|nr:hypothetical protein [Anaerovoracaceae bacterium]